MREKVNEMDFKKEEVVEGFWINSLIRYIRCMKSNDLNIKLKISDQKVINDSYFI